MFSKLLVTATFALSLGGALARVQFAGVNIAGFDFGCGTDVFALLAFTPRIYLITPTGHLPSQRRLPTIAPIQL